ncbi:MAG: hypothetical protein U5K81_12940 [Trueperaceae bacterium]|nr:hypothetical protein [Trueperaceae bacterium]
MGKTLIIALVVAATVIACGPTGAGPGGDAGTPSNCEVSASASNVAAGSLAVLRGIPETAMDIRARHGGDEVAVATLPGGELAVLTPFPDPDDLFASGTVTLAIEIDGNPCDSLVLQASGLPLPDAPGVAGGFRRTVEDAVEAVDDALRVAGLTRTSTASRNERTVGASGAP